MSQTSLEIDIRYDATPKQTMFHTSKADELLYGGAAGGGKSKATVMEALALCLENDGTRAYLFRKTYPELRDTLINEALASYPAEVGKYNEAKHNFTLINGSIICFRYCRNMQDAYKYQGAEIHWLFIDELTHFTKEIYDYLKTRVRANKVLNIRPLIRCTTNPGGIGHGWVKSYFVDAMKPFEIHKKEIFSPTLNKTTFKKLQYIPAYATDNPHLTDDYIFELEQKPEALRKALLNGDWSTFEGQVFVEFRDEREHYLDRKWTHVIEPFEIPKTWRRFRSFDFGYSRPFSVAWWAVDFDGRLYRYRELYGCAEPNVGLKWTPQQIASKIKEIEDKYERDNHIIGIADPSIWDRSRGISIAETMERTGIYFEKADNERLAGKMQFHYRLAFDHDGLPMMYCFSNCKGFIRTIPTLVYDQRDVEDIDTDCEDHVYDEARYMFMANPISPRPNVITKPNLYDPLNLEPQNTTKYGFLNA